MYVGTQNIGQIYIDALGICQEEIIIESDGCAHFVVKGKSVSIWVKKSYI